MIKILQLKNWETFLVLFFVPFLFYLNLFFLTNSLTLSGIFFLIWFCFISIWLYYIIKLFKTNFIDEFEFKLVTINLIVVNILVIVLFLFISLWFNNIIPKNGVISDIFSSSDDLIRSYFNIAHLVICIIASRVLMAKLLQRNLIVRDYYKSTISFIFLPIGIFWIQNNIIEILKVEKTGHKKRGYLLIVLSVFLTILTIFNFKYSRFNPENDKLNNNSLLFDSIVSNEARQYEDSILLTMGDSLKAEYFFKEAIRLNQFGDNMGALEKMNLAIQYDSLNLNYYFNRGLIFSKQHQYDFAILDMNKIIELDKTKWIAYQNRGYYYYLLKKYDKALADINQVILLKKDVSAAYLVRGVIKNELNDNNGACIDLRIADSLGNANALLKIMEICR